MPWDEEEDTNTYKVVINHEEQYSIWPADRENPLGWNDVGKSGPKAECLSYIEEVWTDMRPLSLRRQMEELARNPPPPPPPSPLDNTPEDALVQRLATGRHAIEAGLRPDRTVERLKECLDRQFVHIKFTETQGGTELGIPLEPQASDFGQADFTSGAGSVHLEGNLVLDFVKVRFIGDVDLGTLAGEGYLQIRED